jgi:hypothetical protein
LLKKLLEIFKDMCKSYDEAMTWAYSHGIYDHYQEWY